MKKIKEQLEVDFNQQAEVSQNIQETINQKNLQIEGLQNNNSVQWETIDELHNEVGFFEQAKGNQPSIYPLLIPYINLRSSLTHSPLHGFRIVRLIF